METESGRRKSAEGVGSGWNKDAWLSERHSFANVTVWKQQTDRVYTPICPIPPLPGQLWLNISGVLHCLVAVVECVMQA